MTEIRLQRRYSFIPLTCFSNDFFFNFRWNLKFKKNRIMQQNSLCGMKYSQFLSLFYLFTQLTIYSPDCEQIPNVNEMCKIFQSPYQIFFLIISDAVVQDKNLYEYFPFHWNYIQELANRHNLLLQRSAFNQNFNASISELSHCWSYYKMFSMLWIFFIYIVFITLIR